MVSPCAPLDALVAVAQDALTGQVLWVGLLDADAPQKLAEKGTFCAGDCSDGRPLPVRHLARSHNGSGLIILVEGTSSRRQLDSMWPDPTTAPPPPREPPPAVSAVPQLGRIEITAPLSAEGTRHELCGTLEAFLAALDADAPRSARHHALSLMTELVRRVVALGGSVSEVLTELDTRVREQR